MSEHDLEALLAAAASDTGARPAFAQALLGSKVYVLGSVDGHVESETVPAGSKLVLAHLPGADGPVIPFFTSEAMLTATSAAVPGLDPRFLRMTCRDLWSTTPGARYVLNPHGDYGKTYEPSEIEALLAGYLVTVAAADRQSAMAGFGSIGIGEFTDGNTIEVVVEPDAEPARLLASIEPFYQRANRDGDDSQRRRFFKRR